MKEVEFHVNAPDKLAYSRRLLRKAWASGARMVVLGEPAFLQQLDTLLWTAAPSEFVPHCRAGASPATLAGSPIWLAERVPANTEHSLLVNLGPGVPQGYERFERFIEVVSLADDDVQAGRLRWKHYKTQGHDLTKHDLAGAGARA